MASTSTREANVKLAAASKRTSLAKVIRIDPSQVVKDVLATSLTAEVRLSEIEVHAEQVRLKLDSTDELGGPLQSRYASDFKERRVLGRGGCGEVCEVLNRLDRRTYAIKKVRLTGGASRRDARRQLREVEALAAAFHPHVVRYYQAWIEGLEDAPIQEEFSLLDGFSDEDDDSDSDIISSSSNLTGKPATTTLYIQMEFCAATLRQLIDTRRLEQRRDDQWRLLRQILLVPV